MAVRHQLIKRSRDDVWAVLSDRELYADWVAGTQSSHGGEGDWPAEGSSLEYTIGIGSLSLAGRTTVRQEERPSHLALEVDSGRLGTARIDIEIKPWGENSLVIVDEHPLTGPGGVLHNVALDAVLQLRHRRMLSRLAEVVEQRSPERPGQDAHTGQDGQDGQGARGGRDA
ncbi:SRPBCC family protein [Actinacidiphila acidipaludis]|uniref:SRPBCC family protein n=1 Tax=Actinacidiphila acidipaludis TaxID=2873382 RepID=A0ABS7QGC7_9ACTN|nr:SRPBCC family protein [Streptomyces acidipaludis]MBY8882231.1 SRPBCC family protein [Streptomyces acidipaludis]